MNSIQTYECSIHPDFEIQFANLSNPSDNPFLCQICLLDKGQKDIFASIPQIIKSNDNTPILNWPLGIDRKAVSFLSNQKITNSKKLIKEKIIQFYKDLMSQILNIIQESEDLQIKNLEDMQLETYELMDFYNSCFKRQELKDIFINQSELSQKKYEELVKKLESTRKLNLEQLNKKIDIIQNIENYISFDQGNQIKIIVTQLLSDINFISKTETQDQDSSTCQSILRPGKSDDKNVDQDELSSFVIYNLNKFNNIKQTLQQNIDKIQEQYNDKIQKLNQMYELNTIYKLNMLKSNWQSSQQLSVLIDQNKNLIIKNNNKDECGYIYNEETFAYNKQYTFRFKFNLPFYKCQYVAIGIINNDEINKQLGDSLQFLTYETNGEFQDVKKGNLFKDVKNKEQINELEMRLRLDKGIIQFSDFPNYENVLQNKYKIDQNKQYRLCIILGQQLNKEITITQSKVQINYLPFDI